MIQIRAVREYLLDLQNRICQFLEVEENHKKFISDPWSHHSGGGGITRYLEQGKIIEKAGVSFSHVHGISLPPAATASRSDLAGLTFQAMGVSVIIHPQNPYTPTTHANFRFIITEKADGESKWWFGGGFDLTPYYGFTEDCIHWHQTAKAACAPYGDEIYPKYKKWCDDYFYLKHRNEPRGIGGLFFDDLSHWEFDTCFEFLRNMGDHFIKAYQPILNRRKHLPFGQHERDFQCYRRGRYVEFNLLYDRGTLFGLQTNGRVESILISLPPKVNWQYNWQPEPNSPEHQLYTEFLIAKDWV